MAANCFTDQTPATLPNTQELAEAQEALSAVCKSLARLQWRVQRIARGAEVEDFPEYALVEGDEIPTFAHIGELYVFASYARLRLDEASGYLDTFEEKLENLDTVRLNEGSDG